MKSFPQSSAMLAFLVFLVMVLWLPFGFNVAGIQEEWGHRVRLESPETGSSTAELISRPGMLLTILPAHFITPNSYVAYNLTQAAFFILKGMALFLLLRHLLPASIAMLTAILYVVYPADAGLMTLRGTPIHMASGLIFLSLYLLICYWKHPNRRTLGAMWLIQGTTLLTYESNYAIVVASPLLLIWLARRVTRKVIKVSLLWYMVPAFTLMYSLFHLLRSDTSMGMRLIRGGIEDRSPGTVVGDILNSLLVSYRRHFIDGWLDSIREINLNLSFTLLAVVFALIVSAIVWAFYRQREKIAWRNYLLFALGGFVFIGLALMVYLLTTRRYEDWRVYYTSSAGAAVVVSSLIALFSTVIGRRHQATIYTLLMGTFIGMATLHTLNQHADFLEISQEEQYYYGSMIAQAPEITMPTTFLVVAPPEGDALDPQRIYRGQSLREALAFIYQDYDDMVAAYICYEESRCRFEPEGMTITTSGREETLSYDEVLIFEASAYDGITLLETIPEWLLSSGNPDTYQPGKHIDRSANLPSRVQSIFYHWPPPFPYPLVSQDEFANYFDNAYQPGDQVVIEQNEVECVSSRDCAIRQWVSGVPIEHQVVVADTEWSAQVRTAEAIWVIRSVSATGETALSETHAPVDFAPWNGKLYPWMTRYRRVPASLETILVFGKMFGLQQWTLLNDVEANTCETIDVESWWQALDTTDTHYSLTLTLANESGQGMAQHDSAPANILTPLWQKGHYYFDQRSLTIPCDLESGSYFLLMGIYSQDGETQPVTAPDGTMLSDGLFYLTTLNVS